MNQDAAFIPPPRLLDIRQAINQGAGADANRVTNEIDYNGIDPTAGLGRQQEDDEV